MRIHPGTIEHHGPAPEEQASAGANGTTTHNDSATALFKAISDCQELNPDPDPSDEGEEDQSTEPGAGGWITSDNMADFMDENGNFRVPEDMTVIGGEDEVAGAAEEEATNLGEGAGRTRTAAELDAEDGAADGEDSKWQRTS